jgi:hypothetical protein
MGRSQFRVKRRSARVEHMRKGGIPALDSAASYSSRLSARTALYTELHLLLSDADSALPTATYRMLVMVENRLSRASIAARAKLWKELKARYRLDGSDALFAAFCDEWRRSTSDAERALTAYVLFALNDRLAADLGTEWLFPLLRRAPAEIRIHDVRAFIDRAGAAHPETQSWSEHTRSAVAQKYAGSIRDFGLAKGTVRKYTVRPALYGAPVRLLIRALRLVGTAPLELVQAPVFRLLGLEGAEVIDALGELNRQGALRFRIQGDVVELDVAEAA